MGTIVTENYVEPGVTLDYTGGDNSMSGLDRFGRVVDQVWKEGGVAVDGYDYTYDFAGNVQTKANVMDAALSELYTYNGLDELASAERGTLSFSGGQPTITPVTGCWP